MGEPQKYIYFSPNISTFEIQKGKHAKFFWRIAALTFGYFTDISLLSENCYVFLFKINNILIIKIKISVVFMEYQLS